MTDTPTTLSHSRGATTPPLQDLTIGGEVPVTLLPSKPIPVGARS